MRRAVNFLGPEIAVYSGLTLTQSEVEAILPKVSFRGPIKQLDVLADIEDGYHIIVIIDGVFHHSPAVSPCEIMDALRRGLVVYGCSSMGALRAAELAPYGMRGVGEIFNWVRRDTSFRDDFPALAFAPVSDGAVQLSIPHVDLHFALERMRARGSLSSTDQELLEGISRALYYPDRTLPTMRAVLSRSRPDLVTVLTHACTRMKSQKRLDAVATLKRAKADALRTASVNQALARSPAVSSSGRAARRASSQDGAPMRASEMAR